MAEFSTRTLEALNRNEPTIFWPGETEKPFPDIALAALAAYRTSFRR